jgi:hypothetical protein
MSCCCSVCFFLYVYIKRIKNETIRKSNCLYVNLIQRVQNKILLYEQRRCSFYTFFPFFFCFHYYDIYHQIYAQTHIIINPSTDSGYREQVRCRYKYEQTDMSHLLSNCLSYRIVKTHRNTSNSLLYTRVRVILSFIKRLNHLYLLVS